MQFGSAALGHQTELLGVPAGSYENEPGGDLTSLAGSSSRSPSRPLPLPTFSGPSGGSRPGHASSARGDQAPGDRCARDLGLCPCSVRPGPRPLRPPVARPTGSRRPGDTGARLPVPGRSLSGDSPVGSGRSWRRLSRHIPTNERTGQGGRGQSSSPQPGRAPTALCGPQGAPERLARGGGRGQSPGRFQAQLGLRAGWLPGSPHPLDPHPDSPLALAALQLTPALGPASPLAHLRAPRASRSPPTSPHRTSRESSSLGDLKVSARSPKSCHTVQRGRGRGGSLSQLVPHLALPKRALPDILGIV